MQISSLVNTQNRVEFSKEDRSVGDEYLKVIGELFPTVAYKTRDELNASDSALAQFKESLTTKGAAEFLKDLNEEKIDAVVEEYRQKLLDEQKEDPSKPMDIEKMVSDFKKQLIKELMEAQKADQEFKENAKQLLSTAEIVSTTNMSKEREQAPKGGLNFLEQILSTSNTQKEKQESVLV